MSAAKSGGQAGTPGTKPGPAKTPGTKPGPAKTRPAATPSDAPGTGGTPSGKRARAANQSAAAKATATASATKGARSLTARAAGPSSPPVDTATAPSRRLVWGLGVGTVAVSFVLYVLTTAHGIVSGDTPDFLLASTTFGVAHPPGYPLATMLGTLFSWLPLGSTTFRIDLVAAVCGSATVGFVYAIVLRLTRSAWAAAAAGLVLAFNPLFWKWSLQIETFPLNNLLAATLVYLLVRWHQDPERGGFLVGAAVVFGLGVSNQQTLGFMAPAVLWVLWLDHRVLWQRKAVIGYSVLGLVGGLATYLYIPFAAAGHSPVDWDYVRSLSAFWRLVTRADYGGLLPASNTGSGSAYGGGVVLRTAFILRDLGPLLGVLVAIGLYWAYRTVRWYLWFTVLTFVFTGILVALTTNLDPDSSGLYVLERFFVLPIVLLAPMAGLGVAALAHALHSRWPAEHTVPAAALVAGLCLLLGLVVVGVNYSTLNVSSDNVTTNYATDALEGLAPHTILFVTGDQADSPLAYVNSGLHVRPDVTVLVSPLLPAPWYSQVLRHNGQLHVPARLTTLNIVRANPGRPVSFIGDPPDKTIDGKYWLYPDGLVYDLEPESTTLTVTQEQAAATAKLASYHVPSWRSIKQDSFENSILSSYAAIPANIGKGYQQGGQPAQAKVWYAKAQAIDPQFTPAFIQKNIKS